MSPMRKEGQGWYTPRCKGRLDYLNCGDGDGDDGGGNGDDDDDDGGGDGGDDDYQIIIVMINIITM